MDRNGTPGTGESTSPATPEQSSSMASSIGLPDDLPKSLDDRRSVPVFPQETEIYDAWQG